MPRRILLLITDLELGGLPTVVREVAIRIHRQTNAHIEVACLSAWGPVATQIQDAGVSATALGANGVRDLGVFGRLARLIRGEKFDTVVSFLVHANTVAAVASRFCPGVRFLQSIATTQPHPRWHWWMHGVVQGAADRIIVPTESVKQALCDWSHIPAERIEIIPNAIDPAAFETSLIPLSDVRPYPIGFLGRLDPIKRIPDLLQAVQMLNGLVHLTLFGTGEEGDRIVAEIARLGIGEQVTLYGPVPQAQEALSRIGLLVLPSDAEGFGIVLIEAMAAGVPVVGTNVGGTRDVIRDGKTGLLVPARAPEMLAAAIRRVVEDRPLRLSLIAEGRRDVIARFTWDRVMEQYRNLLGV